jgi:hypothetical protein
MKDYFKTVVTQDDDPKAHTQQEQAPSVTA